MPTISANNADFYYELSGKGHPLVLISGYTADHLAWLPVLDDLSQHFQVLTFDNRGIGRTTDNNQALSAELMAYDVISLTHALGLEKPHILGHSMGGTIAQAIASHYPEELSKLVLLTTTAKWRKPMLMGMKSSLSMREKNIDIDLILDNVIPWLFGEVFTQKTEMVTTFKHLVLNNPFPQSLPDQIRQFNVLTAFNGINELNKIHAPTLVAYGNEDIICLPHEAHFLAQHIANAKLHEFNCAHMVPLEAGTFLVQELLNFLK